MSPNVWLQALPYTSAIGSLVGQTFDIEQLQNLETNSPLKRKVAAFVLEAFTLLMICALSADAGIKSGIHRGALVGAASGTIAYLIPKLYLLPLVTKVCRTCNAWGQLCIGLCMLLCLFLVMLAVNWGLTG